MEPLVLTCEGCGARIRASDPSKARRRDCPRCRTPLAPAVDRALGVPPGPRKSPGRLATGTAAIVVTLASMASLALREPSLGASTAPTLGPVAPPGRSTEASSAPIPEPPEEIDEGPPGDESIPPPPKPAAPPPPVAGPPGVEVPPAMPPAQAPVPPRADAPRRFLVRDPKGRAVVAREHGMIKDRVAVVLPDGQIGWTEGPVETDRPFAPASMDELRESLQADEFATSRVIQTAHYLVFYQSSRGFAQASADLLERLHDGLTGALRKHGMTVASLEFPLVAVIFSTEDDFRASRRVAPDVQAYYEILSNRIYFYERSRRDQDSPEVSALRKPQTVAHEGTHQILHNVGIQPRLSDWPLWLVEGFAEYCSPPRTTKKGVDWAGLGQVNPIHMATIRDLDDPASTQVAGQKGVAIGRDRGTPLVEYLVTRKDLTPTDYALSWALAHYLARERVEDFVAYMKRMSQLRPFEERTPEDQLAAFRDVFGDDLAKMDAKVGRYLARLKSPEALPYFSVVFEQPIGPVLRRMSMVSQSPSVIRQWIETAPSAEGGESRWHVVPHRRRAEALQVAEEFLRLGR